MRRKVQAKPIDLARSDWTSASPARSESSEESPADCLGGFRRARGAGSV